MCTVTTQRKEIKPTYIYIPLRYSRSLNSQIKKQNLPVMYAVQGHAAHVEHASSPVNAFYVLCICAALKN